MSVVTMSVSMTNIIGIDPGASGGIALVQHHGRSEAVATKWPETERDTFEVIQSYTQRGCMVYLEKVHAMPKQGVSSTFKFGQHYGFLRACLIACGVPFETITPSQWQREMSCLSKGNKNVTKARAQELFPNIKITHAIADALLIAECGARRLRNHEQV